MTINPADYVPHGLIIAFGTVLSYIWRDHIKQDDTRFMGIKDELAIISDRQVELGDKISANHAELLKALVTAGQAAATNAAIAAAS